MLQLAKLWRRTGWLIQVQWPTPFISGSRVAVVTSPLTPAPSPPKPWPTAPCKPPPPVPPLPSKYHKKMLSTNAKLYLKAFPFFFYIIHPWRRQNNLWSYHCEWIIAAVNIFHKDWSEVINSWKMNLIRSMPLAIRFRLLFICIIMALQISHINISFRIQIIFIIYFFNEHFILFLCSKKIVMLLL